MPEILIGQRAFCYHLDSLNVLDLPALGAFGHVELHGLPFLRRGTAKILVFVFLLGRNPFKLRVSESSRRIQLQRASWRIVFLPGGAGEKPVGGIGAYSYGILQVVAKIR